MKALLFIIVLSFSFTTGKAQTDSIPSTDSIPMAGTGTGITPGGVVGSGTDTVPTPAGAGKLSPYTSVTAGVILENPPVTFNKVVADSVQMSDRSVSAGSAASIVSEESVKFSFDVYPNPNDGSNLNISVSSNKEKEILVIVYDTLGRELFSKVLATEDSENRTFAIDPSGVLTSGIYIITATSQKDSCSKRLIVK